MSRSFRTLYQRLSTPDYRSCRLLQCPVNWTLYQRFPSLTCHQWTEIVSCCLFTSSQPLPSRAGFIITSSEHLLSVYCCHLIYCESWFLIRLPWLIVYCTAMSWFSDYNKPSDQLELHGVCLILQFKWIDLIKTSWTRSNPKPHTQHFLGDPDVIISAGG